MRNPRMKRSSTGGTMKNIRVVRNVYMETTPEEAGKKDSEAD